MSNATYSKFVDGGVIKCQVVQHEGDGYSYSDWKSVKITMFRMGEISYTVELPFDDISEEKIKNAITRMWAKEYAAVLYSKIIKLAEVL
ncbi:hypothetical protein MYO4S_00026 [Serratia phage 4S]|nr:hypothetical protein MYO4S_00026 [Serratia phage 4S]